MVSLIDHLLAREVIGVLPRYVMPSQLSPGSLSPTTQPCSSGQTWSFPTLSSLSQAIFLRSVIDSPPLTVAYISLSLLMSVHCGLTSLYPRTPLVAAYVPPSISCN